MQVERIVLHGSKGWAEVCRAPWLPESLLVKVLVRGIPVPRYEHVALDDSEGLHHLVRWLAWDLDGKTPRAEEDLVRRAVSLVAGGKIE